MNTAIVLTANFEYHGEASIKRVLKWLMLNKIEVIECNDSEEVGTLEFRIKMPLVVRLLNFFGIKSKNRTVKFSSDAVYNRDDNFCQYWHKDESGRKFKYRCSVDERSIDHVLPVSRGGKSSFENCVTACRECNEIKKKNRTPDEAGLEFLRKPFAPIKIILRPAYNSKKLCYKVYFEKVLGRAFTHLE